MQTTVTWHGRAAFQVTTADCSILVDPFFSGNQQAVTSWEALTPPNLVLVTHLHNDHLGDSIAICQKTGALLGTAVDSARVIVRQGLSEDLILNGHGFNIGGTVSFRQTRITMTEAFHSAEAGACTGFIITLPNGFTIYHAGDTGIFANMATWGDLYPIDLAVLPIGGVYTMDERQAAQAACFLQAKAVLPIHWGTFPVLATSPDLFKAELASRAPQCECLALQPGESRLVLSAPTCGTRYAII